MLHFGVSHCSVLGPLLFSLYVASITDIVKDHDLGNMFYADDTQLYVAINPKDSSDISSRRLEKCISKIKICNKIYLKLNDNKTTELLFGSPYFIREIYGILIQAEESQIMSVKSVRNFGAYFDEANSKKWTTVVICCSLQSHVKYLQRLKDSPARLVYQAL